MSRARSVAQGALTLTLIFARLGARYGGIGGLLFGGIFAIPLAIMAGLLALALALALLGLLISAMVGVLTLIVGETLASLTLLAGLIILCYHSWHAICAFCANRIKLAYLDEYFPFLTAYAHLLTRYPAHHLPSEYRTEIEHTTTLLARTLLDGTDVETLHEFKLSHESDPRHILMRLIFTPRHFAHLTLASIQDTFPAPCDLDALDRRLSDASRHEIARRGGTILGEQFIPSPTLFHRVPDATLCLDFPDRFKHCYIIGKTGAGKTNLLKHLITQDLTQHDRGVIVLSPEDGIFQSLLPRIPPDRRDDLIYFDPTDTTDPVIGFNCFDFTDTIALDPATRAVLLTQRAGETYTIFERALGDLGVKMTTLLQNIAYALLQLPHSTILDFDPLLDPRNPTLRTRLLDADGVDPRTKRFWEQYETSTYYKSAYEPVVNRLEPFFRPPLSLTLSTPSFSFHSALQSATPRIIFLNLSRLRGIQAQTLGQLLIANIQQSLLGREEIPERDRTPYFFYLDEFSLFTTSEQSFIDLFERARKYRMGVTLAHQVMADLPSKLLDTIVGNVASMLVLTLGAGDAPYFAKELQLIDHDDLKERKLMEQEGARLDREALRIARTGAPPPDLLADPLTLHRIREKIRLYSEGSLAPALLQNLPTGKAIAKVPSYNYGVPVTIPYVPDTPAPAEDSPAALIAHSKSRHGKKCLQTSSPLDEPEPEPAPTQSTPRPAPRKRGFKVMLDTD